MARKPRINEPGFYHIVNRGVNNSEVFIEKEDYHKFLELLLKVKYDYDITIHAFTILPNHYHVLIQTHKFRIMNSKSPIHNSESIIPYFQIADWKHCIANSKV